MKRDIRIERFYAYPPERVFRALTDPAAMADWLMKNDFQPRLGHKFQFRAKPQGSWNGVTDCEVTVFDPPRQVAYTWRGQDVDPAKPPQLSTTVTWTLTREGNGTRLRLDHTGFKGFGEVLISFILSSGWKSMLKKRLPAAIERVKDGDYASVPGAVPECST